MQHCVCTNNGSWDSVASILTTGGTIRVSISCKSKRYLFMKTPTTAARPPRLLFDGYQRDFFFSPGVKWPPREAHHSLHIVPRLRTSGKILPLPLYVQKQLYVQITIFGDPYIGLISVVFFLIKNT